MTDRQEALDHIPAVPQVSLSQIMLLFARIGLTSFGGGLSAWIYREVVDRYRWMGEDEFLGGLTMAQILPGPNVINLSIYIGQRLRGGVGSLVAVGALLLPPMVLVIVLLGIFHRFGDLPWVHDLLEGVAAGAIGLTFSVGVRSARRSAARHRWPLLMILAIFVMIGLMRWPMLPVVLCLIPVGLWAAWRER
ncbi:MAG TPA: chromate transporter [Terriglobia bacterium]|nr:chromate transporter [Terriglobia bacterium]